MIAKLERTQRNACQSKDKHRTPTNNEKYKNNRMYRILTRAFVDGVMNVFSSHIEQPPPPPPEYPSILRMNGYYKHLEADNVLIQQS